MSRPHAFNEYRFACRYLPCRARDAHPAPLRVRYQPLSQPSDGMARAATEIALRPRWRSHIPGVRLQYIVRAWTIIYRTLTLPLTRRLPVICARCGPSFKGFIGTANGTDCSQTYDCATKTGPSSWRFSTDWTQGQLWNRQEFGDSSWEMFARMYERRRKGYASIGYERVPPQIPVEVENNNATEPHRSSATSEG